MRIRTGTARLLLVPGVLVPGLLGLIAFAAATAALARDDGSAIDVGNPSLLRKLVPVEKVEQAGALQYQKLTDEATREGRLLPESDPMARRVRDIAIRLLPHAIDHNPRAREWAWQVNVFKADIINAFCMPGGKIAIYTGLIDRLALTDNEIAMIMGHEIAHALREHARERMAKGMLTNVGVIALGWFTKSDAAARIANMGGKLLTLKFSRNDETEADLVGMEMAARAGFDPRAGVTLWQKMSRATKGQPQEFLSTHPSGESRIEKIRENLPKVMPLYEAAR